jgi:putative selenium metabolism hydrolase
MNIVQKIRALSEDYREYTTNALVALVRIKSLSCQEKDVVLACQELMMDADLESVWIDPLGNIIGQMGQGEKSLAFDAHLDVVDTGNLANWDFEPFSAEIRDGYVCGRGSVDQKGGMAAMLTAAKILKDLDIYTDQIIYFVGSVMEEDCDGLCWSFIINEDGIKPNLVVSTEPTDLCIHRGQRGRMEMEVIFRGISAHGSAPERGENAIYKAARACLDLENLNKSLASDDFLGKGSIAVTSISSNGPSLCAIPDEAKLHIDRRLTWGETKDSAVTQVKNVIKNKNVDVNVLYYQEKAYTGLAYGMEKYYPTWKLPKDHFAVKIAAATFRQLFDQKPKIDKWTFSTNGVTINGIYNIPTIGFGPGIEAMAHAPNEKVFIDDVVKASAYYALLALNTGQQDKKDCGK